MMRQFCFSLLFGCLILGFSGSSGSTEDDFDKILLEKFTQTDPFKNQENVALEKSGARAVVKTAAGAEKSAKEVIDGSFTDDYALCLQLTGTPFEITISFPKPIKISGVRIFPGITAWSGNPSGEVGIKSYQLQGYRDGSWVDLVNPVKNAPTFNELNADSFYSFNYIHSFQPVLLEKIRLVVLESSDTGFRADSPRKPVPSSEFVTWVREIQVFSGDKKQ